jgi:hypothetical protein
MLARHWDAEHEDAAVAEKAPRSHERILVGVGIECDAVETRPAALIERESL